MTSVWQGKFNIISSEQIRILIEKGHLHRSSIEPAVSLLSFSLSYFRDRSGQKLIRIFRAIWLD